MIARRLFLLAASLLPLVAWAESLVIEPKHAKFDTATAFSTVQQRYTVVNNSDKPVRIKDWKAIAGHGEVKGLPEVLAPGERREFEVVLELPGKLGSALHRFAIFTDEPGVERYRFTLSGFVLSLVSPAHAVIDFGKTTADAGGEQKVTLSASEKTPLALQRVVSAPDWIDARVEGTTVSARIRPAAALGMRAGVIQVATNLPQQPFVEVTTKAIVEGALRPSTYGVGMKPLQVGERATASIELIYTGRSDLAALKVDAPEGWEVARSACQSELPPETRCVRIGLARPLTETGRSTGFFTFRLAGEPDLAIPFGVIALGKDQTIRELVIDEGKELGNSGYVDVAKALQQGTAAGTPAPVAETTAAAPERIAHSEGRGPVKLAWSARNDDKIFGYVVYRAEDRAGPFVRISEQPIARKEPAAGSDKADYAFVDASISPGATYYYYIDVLGSDGEQRRFSPVLSKKVLK